MGKIYINQPFQIKTTIVEDIDGTETVVDISGLTIVFFYVDPDGVEASFSPVIIDDGPSGTCHYDVPSATLDKAGRYTFWAVVTFGNGDIPAEPMELTLYSRGK